MPIVWSLPPNSAVFGQGFQTVNLTESLRVTAKSYTLKRIDLVAEFAGKVEAVFGVTKLNGDQITFYLPTDSSRSFIRRAIAKGNVTLVDPDGTISAQRLEFDWETGIGTASEAVVNIGGMNLSVAQIEIQPGQWTLNGVNASLCEDRHIGFACKKLVYRPSERAAFHNVQLKFFGKTIIGQKSYSLDLGPEDSTTLWPNIVIGGSKGIGVQWTGRHKITDGLRFSAKFGISTDSSPWGEAYLSQGFLPLGSAIRAPRSDSAEVASSGFFENVRIRDPETEISREREVRGSISLGTTWNQSQYTDLPGQINKPYELILEGGGNLNEFGWFAQIRNHKLDQIDADDLNRVTTLATVSLPSISISKKVKLLSRIDSRTYASGQSDQGGWIRGQAGVVLSLDRHVRIGVAYSNSTSFGDPPSTIDALDSKSAFHFRADLAGGSTNVSTLLKYDPDRKDWYDYEFSIHQLAGCIEPFVSFRSRPRRITFGFTLRPFEKIQRLEESTSKRLIGNHLPPKN